MNFNRLDKCQEYLEEEVQLLHDFNREVLDKWSGSDSEELQQKINELAKQIKIVIKNIDLIRIELQTASEEKTVEEGEE